MRVVLLANADVEPLPQLHVHSHFSLRLGASSVNALVQAAVDAGCPALALTDRNACYGLLPFLKACREAQLPAIIGVELDDPGQATRRAVCWVRTYQGYRTLCAAITRRCVMPETFDLVTELAAFDPEDLWAGTGDLTLLTQVAALKGARGWFALLYPDSRRDVHAPPDLLQGWARKLGLPVALVSDALMARPADLRTHRVVRKIATRYSSSWTPGEEALVATEDTVIWDRQASARWSARYPEAARGAIRIGEACADRVDPFQRQWVMPPVHLSPGTTAEEALWERAHHGCRRLFKGAPSEDVTQRLKRELKVICEKGYASYFLVTCELVDQAEEWGVVTLGRGSVADSLVAYCCGLTQVDPMAHDLYFERFLNPDRPDPPDIDLDFSWRVRDRMLQFLFDRYPAGHVAMVGCHHTLRARGAYREAALALGLHPSRVGLSKRLPYASAVHLPKLLEHYPEVSDLPLEEPAVIEALEVGQALAGTPIATGMHPCGIVIAPRPLTHWTPLERCAKGYLNTQFEMYAVEEAGLIKIDVLATRGLGTVDTVRATLQARGGYDPLAEDFDAYAGHPAARRLLRQGRTIGCFYTESPAMLQLNRKTQCSDYRTLIATSSVIRPGVAESGMMDQYIERHLDPRKIEYQHPMMKELLEETHGIMIYQEDVMKVAHFLAGMTLAEADSLRRSMGFKRRDTLGPDVIEQRFMEGCRRQQVSPAAADEIWRQISSFASFAFCKAHSAAFARLSMQTCRLKAEYPAEFLAAVLSNQGGYYPAYVYVEEARRWGLAIHGPDVNGSQEEYWGYGCTLRVGFMAIKGLETESIATILAARNGIPFWSFPDFLERTRTGASGLHPTQVLLLIDAGACDSLGGTRADFFVTLLNHVARVRAQRDRTTLPLFPNHELVPELKGGRDRSQAERYVMVMDLLGFLPHCHPLAWLRPSLSWSQAGPPLVAVRDLPQHLGRRVRVLGLGVTRKVSTTRKNNERMAFLSLDEETGTAEVTFFPRVYAQTARYLNGWGPYVVTGLVDERHGVINLNAEALERATVSVALPDLFNHTPLTPFAEQAGAVVPTDPVLAALINGTAPPRRSSTPRQEQGGGRTPVITLVRAG